MSENYISEQLKLRTMLQKDCYKIIDYYLLKFYKERNIQQTDKMFYSNDYIHDYVIKEEFRNILEARTFMRKEYKRFLKHSEINNIKSFCRNYFEKGYGEKS